jgi:hypothetical protein
VPPVRRAAFALVFLLAALILPAFMVAAGQARASVHQVPRTIRADCSVDVTVRLRSWLRALPKGSVARLAPKGCYRVDGTLELRHRSGLSVDGRGATLRAMTDGDPNRATWRFVDSSGIALSNMTVQGTLPPGVGFTYARQWQHAFDFRGVRGVALDRARAVGVFGDGVYIGLGEDPSKAWTTGVRIRDSAISRAGRMGVSVVAGRDVLVQTTRLSGIGLTPFDIEPNGNGDGARDVTFRDNGVTGPLSGAFLSAVGNGPVDGVRVEGNTVSGAGMYMAFLAPAGTRRTRVTIVGNRSDTGYAAPGSAAIDFDGVDGATVSRNRIPLAAPNMALVAAQASCAISVSSNAFPGGVAQARISPFACPAAR